MSGLTDIAIGLAVVDALGNGGDVLARPNSILFNNSVDAWGMPRNRFNMLQPLGPMSGFKQASPFSFTTDLRDILGGNADVYSSNPGSPFSRDAMSSLMGLGIFGQLIANLTQVATLGGERLYAEEEAKRKAAAAEHASTTPAPGVQGGAQPAVQPAVQNASVAHPEPLDEIPVQTATPAKITPATTRVAATTSSATAPKIAAATAPPAEDQIVRRVPAGFAVPDETACKVDEQNGAFKLCVSTVRQKPPGLG